MFRAPELSAVDPAHLFELSPNPYVILDRSLAIVGMNGAYLSVTGRTREGLLGRNLFEAFPSEPGSVPDKLLRRSLEKVLTTGTDDTLPLIPYPIARDDGVMEDRYWSATHKAVRGAGGEVAFVLQHTVDVTELHLLRQTASERGLQLQTDVMNRADTVAMQNLQLGEERAYLRSLFEQAPGFMAVLLGPDHVFDIANEPYLQLVGHRELIGRTVREALPEIEGQGFFELLDLVMQTGQPESREGARVLLQRTRGGALEERVVDLLYQPLKGEGGKPFGIFVIGYDVTEKHRAVRAAQDSEGRFQLLAQSIPNHAWTALPDGRLDWFNDQVYRFSGVRPGELDGEGWAELVHPEDRAAAAERWQASLADGSLYETEFRLRRYDGMYRWHIARAVPFVNAAGEITRWVGTNTDIEDPKATAQALEHLNATLEDRVQERTAELMQTQEVLRQSQKMEAIGNLAGGIAHDFNNLLQVISGNLQLLGADIAGNERAERRVANALSGVVRGARLASQLLSFSRRQPLEPRAVNLGRLIRDLDHLMRRSLGEGIEIDTIVGGGLWTTQVDPANVENAILNLAINARDAMEGHGKLTIEVGNAFLDDHYARMNAEAVAGQYVMLAVSDTGAGMTPEVLRKAFDPFFTTKPAGRGTGLGLSMVYGFVKQSGGHIKIYSEPGNGTTVKLYLPRSLEAEDKTQPGSELAPPAAGGNETVLVVEDDEAVRETTVGLLGELGYRVLKAKDADSALTVVESGIAIDLLFTDVVMPGRLKSRDLARKAKERLPGLAVLFTSGYTENSIVHGGRLDPGVHLLSKPYTREALAVKIRQVIEATAPEASGGPDTAADGDGAVPIAGLSPAPPVSGAGLVVLLCEDEVLIRMATADALLERGMTVIEAGSGGEALAQAPTARLDVLVTDVGLPDMSGIDLARQLRERQPDLPVVFATGDAGPGAAAPLDGAAVIIKPFSDEQLADLVTELAGRAAGRASG
ncbi:hybrid sensor histidine kinase/response regulator [Methylobrevis albus]|uniref:histidine kinase n=1 Tax=Methylobrevis albus TaxID=2793297 RepID=A0A931HZ18_9HYPH|nr:response regulator [Methylobrevis albus]MBH0236268.1 PAS domain-containing protein [Methylobrevis albus]